MQKSISNIADYLDLGEEIKSTFKKLIISYTYFVMMT